MEGHLLCNDVLPTLSLLWPRAMAQTRALIHVWSPQRGKMGKTWRDIFLLPWCDRGRVTDGMRWNGSEIKEHCKAKEADLSCRGGEWEMESDKGWAEKVEFTQSENETSCNKSCRLAYLCSLVCFPVVRSILWCWGSTFVQRPRGVWL